MSKQEVTAGSRLLFYGVKRQEEIEWYVSCFWISLFTHGKGSIRI
jgi:hypothetical protein